jgi:MICAL-like protein 1
VLKKKRQAPTPPVSDQKKDQVQLRRKISIDENLQSIDYERNVVATDDMRKRKLTPFDDQKLGVTQNSHSELEKDKDEKDISNLNLRFSTDMSLNDNQTSSSALNKSTDGRWKRRKDRAAPIPGFAQPQRRILQMLPMQEIRQELEKIEIQQQGLEKQGVTLEKMIRERCEGADDNRTTEELLAEKENGIESKNPKEVDELIIQLFELVNEKNELFRRQAELMYLRREHRLEEEQADVEFEIRKLLSQPENNKTDHDKAREEALIQRLVEIVALRDEIVNCLDRDRLREFEEDKVS